MISSFTLNGSNNVIHLHAEIPNMIINGHNNKILCGEGRKLMNVIINGSNNLIRSADTNFAKMINGHNNVINNEHQRMFGANLNDQQNIFGANLNIYNNFVRNNNNFNININNRNFQNFQGVYPNIDGILNVINRQLNRNYQPGNYYEDDEEDYEDSDEMVEEECEESEEEEEINDSIVENRKKKFLDLNRFQFKHVNLYVSKIDNSCSICSKKYKRTDIVIQFSCLKHIFHEKCLLKWIEKFSFCPVCKEDLMSEK